MLPEQAGGLTLLGRSDQKHFSKLLLELLSPDDPLAAYRRFLQSTVSFSVGYRTLTLLDDALLAEFYRSRHPHLGPKYLDFFRDGDLAKLERCLGVRVVVLQGGTRLRWTKVHDRRVYDALSPPPPDADAARLRLEERTFFLALEALQRPCRFNLYRLDPVAAATYVPLASEGKFVARGLVGAPADGCLARRVWKALGEADAGTRRHLCCAACEDLTELVFSPAAARACLGVSLVLATHLAGKPNFYPYRRLCSGRNHFGVLCVVGERPPLPAACPVVCVTADGHFYELGAKYAGDVLRVRADKVRQPPREDYPGFAGDVVDPEAKKPNRAGGGGVPVRRPADSERFANDGCPCAPCAAAPSFAANMSRDGPQALYRQDLSTFDLLRLLGRLTPEVEADLLRVCHLCVASFDVESVATSVDGASGNEDLSFPAATGSNPVSDQKIPRVTHAVHEPVLIGFRDQRMLECGEPARVFREEEGRDNALVADFVEALFEARDAATVVKYGILSELFSWLDGYRRAHQEFFAARGCLPAAAAAEALDDSDLGVLAELAAATGGDASFSSSSSSSSSDDDDDDDREDARRAASARAAVDERRSRESARRAADVERAWENGVFGLLERRLRHLAHAYTCYGFNAESFDLVLLCSRLVTYAKESGRAHVRLQKEGSKVRYLVLESVRIAEIKRLVGPGTSLDSLAKTCGVAPAGKQFPFPFDLFVDRAFLERPALPADAASWASALAPDKAPTQADVDAALAFYSARGFGRVGDYLEHYLRLDVDLLLASAVALSREYYRVLGLCFVDSRKYTVSSLSAAGAQTFLARNKRPGAFFPNHARTYSVGSDSALFRR
jgi:hypothetical protein